MRPTAMLAVQTIQGVVTKAGVMAKTVTLTVERTFMHPKLFKSYIRHKKYLVHDEHNTLSVGDKIIAAACRPLSARKRFTLLQKVSASKQKDAELILSAEDKEKIRIDKLVQKTVSEKARGVSSNPSSSQSKSS